MDATRHKLTKEQINLSMPISALVEAAESMENAGNWYLAGERYRDALAQTGGAPAETAAKLLARAATCFDIAGQRRAAACAYFEAALQLQNNKIRFQVAGELFNRAALLFRGIGEYFNAGDSWRRAGSAFAQVSDAVVVTDDNIPPVPGAAGRYTVAGLCYTAGGDSFLLAGDEAMWACMSYWEAGRAHTKQEHGHYHAFVAYRKALAATARLYGTHNREKLRDCLPLTEQERAAGLDPLVVMEGEAFRANDEHRQMNTGILKSDWARNETDRQIGAAFHEFYLTFAAIGNGREAGEYRAAEKERARRLMFAEQRYGSAALYWIWDLTSGFGESLGRWALTCAIVLLGFSLLYATFGLAEPVCHWFDYFYFSVVTFTSLGYGDIHPVGVAGKVAACAEIVSGLVMLGLLLTFVGSRFQRS